MSDDGDDDTVDPPPDDDDDDDDADADPPPLPSDVDNVDPPPIVPPLADDVAYVSLNAVDFSNDSCAWSNPSTSIDIQHLPDPDPDPTFGPYDSMVEATLHQLNIATN